MDILLSNYSDVKFIFDLEIRDFVDVINKAFEKEKEKKEDKVDDFILHRWGYELPLMKDPIQFDEYRKLSLGITEQPKVKSLNITNEELISKVNSLKELDQKRYKKEGDKL